LRTNRGRLLPNGFWCAGPRWLEPLQDRAHGRTVPLGHNNTLSVPYRAPIPCVRTGDSFR
jgi:hypothetical protein